MNVDNRSFCFIVHSLVYTIIVSWLTWNTWFETNIKHGCIILVCLGWYFDQTLKFAVFMTHQTVAVWSLDVLMTKSLQAMRSFLSSMVIIHALLECIFSDGSFNWIMELECSSNYIASYVVVVIHHAK
jgi:hypothetical protein